MDNIKLPREIVKRIIEEPILGKIDIANFLSTNNYYSYIVECYFVTNKSPLPKYKNRIYCPSRIVTNKYIMREYSIFDRYDFKKIARKKLNYHTTTSYKIFFFFRINFKFL